MKQAFTLIELLIVITIITLITSWWVIYFFKQVSSLKLSSEINTIIDIVDTLNSEVESRNIVDYSINIDLANNTRWFSYTTNTLWLDKLQELDLNSSTGIGVLSTNYTWTWSYVFKTFSWIKFEWENIIDATESFSKSFLDNSEYKISWSFSGSILNNIYIKYYSDDNIVIGSDNYLELVKITETNDNTWTQYSSVEIKNLNWKKIIKWNTGWELESVYLYFQRDGLEKFIEIKK